MMGKRLTYASAECRWLRINLDSTIVNIGIRALEFFFEKRKGVRWVRRTIP